MKTNVPKSPQKICPKKLTVLFGINGRSLVFVAKVKRRRKE